MGVISRKLSKICGIAVFAMLILCLGALILPTMLVESASAVRDTVHDAMNINVLDQCTMQINATGEPADESKTFTGDATVVGAEVTLYSDGIQNSAHNFEVFCNARSGYTIKGEATDLVPTSASVDATIPFNISSDYFRTGTASNWTAIVTGLDDDSSDKIKTPRSDPDYDGIIFRSNGIEARDFGVSYAVYVGTEAVSATYAGDATFTMAALPDPDSESAIRDGMSMQSISQTVCENTPTDTMFDVVDPRDGKHYYVAHYHNDIGGEYEINECWMVQNLDLDLVVKDTVTGTIATAGEGIDGENGVIMGTTDTNGNFVPFTSANTDISSATWTVPSGSKGYTTQTSAGVAWNTWGTNGGTSATDKADTYEVRSYNAGDNCFTANSDGSTPWSNIDTSDPCDSLTISASTKHEGNMYNYPAATAGTILNVASSDGTDASGSICPKGWQLPYGSPGDVSISGEATRNRIRSYYRLLNSFSYSGSTANFPADIFCSNAGGTCYRNVMNAATWSIIMSDPPAGFAEVRPGFYSYVSGTVSARDWSGFGRTSTTSSSVGGFYLDFQKTGVFPGTDGNVKGYGLQVRCVLRAS